MRKAVANRFTAAVLTAALLAALLPAALVVPALAETLSAAYSWVMQPSVDFKDGNDPYSLYGSNTVVLGYTVDANNVCQSVWSLVDSTGKKLKNLPYYEVGTFSSNGYAVVTLGSNSSDCRYGMIDENGVPVISCIYDYLTPESAGYTLASTAYTNQYGYTSASKVLINVKTGAVSDLSIGSGDDNDLQYGDGYYYVDYDGYYDLSGRRVVFPTDIGKLITAAPFSNGYAFIKTVSGDVYSIIDKSGTVLGSYKYNDYNMRYLPDFSPNGLAKVSVSADMYCSMNEKTGYIGPDGKLAIPLAYHSRAYDFQNGYARVYTDDESLKSTYGGYTSYGDRSTLIDTSGNTVTLNGVEPCTDVTKEGRLWCGSFTTDVQHREVSAGIAQLTAGDTAALTLSGSTSVAVPVASGAPSTVKLTAAAAAGGSAVSSPVVWSIEGTDHTGVEIGASTGTVAVSSSAKPGTYKAVALCGGSRSTLTFTVTRVTSVPKSIAISVNGSQLAAAGDTVTIYPGRANTRSYTAQVLDQYGDPCTGSVDWTLTNGAPGFSLNGGTLTVQPLTADKAQAVIEASCGEIKHTFTVTAAAIPDDWARIDLPTSSRSDNTVTTNVRLISADGAPQIDCRLLTAMYDEKGRLLGTSVTPESISGGEGVIVKVRYTAGAVKTLRVFVLDDTDCAPLAAMKSFDAPTTDT